MATFDYFDDTVEDSEAPAVASPAPAPTPATPAKGGAKWDYFDEPTVPASADPVPAAAKDDQVDGGSWAIARGARAGLGTTPATTAAAIRGVNAIAGGDDDNLAGSAASGLDYLAQVIEGDDQLRSPTFTGIRSAEDFKNWALESLGQAAGSTLAPILGGMAGAAVAGPPGMIAGAAGTSLVTGYGTMVQALEEDPAIQKLVEEGKVDKATLGKYAIAPGLVIGGLDTIGLAKIGQLLGLKAFAKDEAKELVKKALVARIANGLKEGAVAEGVTEGAQQAVQEAATVLSGGDPDVYQRALNIFNSSAAGAVGGAGLGGAAGALNTGKNTEGQNTPGDEEQSTDANPPAGADTGPSTPGGLGEPPTPPQTPRGTADVAADAKPAGEAANPPRPAPVAPTPTNGVDPAVAAALGAAPVEEEVDETEIEEEEPSEDDLAVLNAPEVVTARRNDYQKEKPVVVAPAARAPAPAVDPAITAAIGASGQKRGAAAQTPTASPPTTGDAGIGAPSVPQVTPTFDPKVAPAPPALDQAISQQQIPGIAPSQEAAPAVSMEPAGVVVSADPDLVAPGEVDGSVPGEPSFPPDMSGSPASQIIPEPEQDTLAQINALKDPTSGKDAVLITPKTALNLDPSVVEGMDFAVTDQGLFISTNPEKIAAVKARGGKISMDEMGQLLDYTTPKLETDGTAVQARDPAGAVVHEELTNQQMLPTAVAQAENMAPEGGHVVVTDGQTALAERETNLQINRLQDALRLAAEEVRARLVAEGVSLNDAGIAITAAAGDLEQELKGLPDGSVGELQRAILPLLSERADKALVLLDEHRQEQALQQTQTEAVKTAEGRRIALTVDKERKVSGTGQERARETATKAKTPEQIRAEKTERPTILAAKRPENAEKPWAKKALEADEQRKGRGTNRAAKQEAARKFAEAKEERAREAEEKAPAPSQEVVVQPSIAEEAAQIVAVQTESPDERNAREKTERERKANKERQRLAAEDTANLTPIVEGLDIDKIDQRSMARAEAGIRALIDRLLDEGQKVMGRRVVSKIDKTNSPLVNLMIFAKKARDGIDGMGPIEFLTALSFLKAGELTEFWNMLGEGDIVQNRIDAQGVNDIRDFYELKTDAGDIDVSPMLGSPLVKKSPFAPGDPRVTSITTAEMINRVMKGVKASDKSSGTGVRVNTVVRRALARRLKKLVGNVPLHIVDSEVMQEVLKGTPLEGKNALGLHVDASVSPTGQGYILIDDMVLLADPEFLAHVVLHEAVHAATVYMINQNINNAGAIFDNLRRAAMEQLRGTPEGEMYGFANAREFIAEALTNVDFQSVLHQLTLPESWEDAIFSKWNNRKMTLWDYMVMAITNMMNMAGFGRQGMSYLEGVLRLTPMNMMSDMGQRLDARKRAQVNQDVAPMSPFDGDAMLSRVQKGYDATLMKLDAQGFRASSRRGLMALQNTMVLERRANPLFGGDGNVFQKAIRLFMSTSSAKRHMRQRGDNLAQQTQTFTKADPAMADKMADVLFDATVAGVDPRVPLTDKANQHISKNGITQEHQRQAHAALYREWQKLSPEAKKLFDDHVSFHKDMYDKMLDHLMDNILSNAIKKFGLTLPPGKTLEDAKNWVLNGGIDRVGTLNETQADKDFREALAETGTSLKQATGMRRVRGVYSPLIRRGKYVLSAREKLVVPPGAAQQGDNQLVFKDKKVLRDYLKRAHGDGIQIERVQSIWRDPNTGLVGRKTDDDTVQEYVVTVQNKVVEFSDNLTQLQKRGKELAARTDIDQVIVKEREEGFGKSMELLPRQLQRLVNNTRQSSRPDGVQAQIEGAIFEAGARQMAGTRVQHRRLMRRNVKGFSRDLAETTLETNVSMSNYVSNLEIGPQLADAMQEADKYVKDHEYAGSQLDNMRRQGYVRELAKRIERAENFNESAFYRNILTYSFLTHLWSPAYTLINSFQPGMVTAPVLASKYGWGATLAAMTKAYYVIGAGAILKTGLGEQVRSIKEVTGRKNAPPDYTVRIHDNIAKHPNAGAYMQAVDAIAALGLGPDAGIEADVGEIGKGAIGKGLHRASRMARAMPEAMEAINRYVTAIATVDLAQRAGMSPEQVTNEAVHMVESTQGGYTTENAPPMVTKFRLLLQFKKYSLMLGNLLGTALYDATRGDTPQSRKEGRKALANLALTHGAMAGMVGLPFLEFAKGMVLVSAGLGLGDDDWEDWENWMQEKVKQLIGAFPAEVVMRGLPRLIAWDLSNRLGADSLLMFGEPRDMKEADVKKWLFDMVAGAPIGMATQLVQAFNTGKIEKAPLPKWISDSIKAGKGIQEGVKTEGGKTVLEPYSLYEGATQAAGIRPARAARAWEAGGGGRKNADKKKQITQRTKVMDTWLNAPSAEARQAAWKRIQEGWNQGEGKDNKIKMSQLLRNKQRRAKEAKKNPPD